MSGADVIHLSAAGARASIALHGAEPVSWRVEGRELIWGGDPAHWGRHAPILFPVIGASRGGAVTVAGRGYPMPRHGFARDARFALVEQVENRARLRLTDSAGTRVHYPYPFQLDLVAELSPLSLSLAVEVSNPGPEPLPYAAGFHPAFSWPFDGAESMDGHAILFEAEEERGVPLVTPEGLLRRKTRPVPIEGRRLALEAGLFEEDAMIFLDARSRAMRFVSPRGAAIELTTDMPHLALWTKPGAPFLSLEAWTDHAEPDDHTGDLKARPSTRLLPPGASARHAMGLAWFAGERDEG